MTKAELIKAVAEKTGLTEKNCASVIGATFETVAATMAAKGEVEVTGFGKFSRAFRDARKGRNIATGGTIDIPARGAAKFSPSSVLKKALV